MLASILLVVIGFAWMCLLASAAKRPYDNTDKALGTIAILIHVAGIAGLIFKAFT